MLNWLMVMSILETLDVKSALISVGLYLTVPKKEKYLWSDLKRQQYALYKSRDIYIHVYATHGQKPITRQLMRKMLAWAKILNHGSLASILLIETSINKV